MCNGHNRFENSFDDKGCDHCNTYSDILPKWHTDEKGDVTLKKIVKKIKKEGKGKDFDCIMGMSGGIDSSYLLYIMVKKYDLRPLVFHVDAGWNSQIAVNNIQRLIDGLGLDLYTEVINWEEMKDLQLAFFKSGVSHIDTPQDHAFFATMYKFASNHNIKYILTGGNYSTECIRNPLEWMYYQSDSIQLRDIYKKHGTGKLKDYPVTNILWHKIYLPYIKRIKLIRPLDFVPYNKDEAMELLVEKFGYQKYPQKHFESRFTRFYESFWLPKKFGYDTRKVQYSSLILTNQMTRKEALEKLKTLPYNPETIQQDFEYIATKLGISIDELQSYMDAPNKTYKDYKSQENIYNIGAKVMRLLDWKKEEKMIGIINYGSGNVQAIATIYKKLNIEYRVMTDKADLKKADKLVLPGVGAFDATMQQLIDSGLREELNNLVINKTVPILGICVGLQIMGFDSDEGSLPGLGWIPGRVKKFNAKKIEFKPKLPHMGWNTIKDVQNHRLFQGIDYDFGFYFVHSFYFECEKEENILSISDYGGKFVIYIQKSYFWNTIPQKKSRKWRQLLKNFADLC